MRLLVMRTRSKDQRILEYGFRRDVLLSAAGPMPSSELIVRPVQ
jgi:hypothetical protein